MTHIKKLTNNIYYIKPEGKIPLVVYAGKLDKDNGIACVDGSELVSYGSDIFEEHMMCLRAYRNQTTMQ